MNKAVKFTKILGVLQIFIGMASVSGGLPMLLDPEQSAQNYPKDLLVNTPFNSLLIPAIILVFIVGGFNLIGAYVSLKFKSTAATFGMVAGTTLLAWIIVQALLIGLSTWLQQAFLIFALLELVMAFLVWKHSEK